MKKIKESFLMKLANALILTLLLSVLFFLSKNFETNNVNLKLIMDILYAFFTSFIFFGFCLWAVLKYNRENEKEHQLFFSGFHPSTIKYNLKSSLILLIPYILVQLLIFVGRKIIYSDAVVNNTNLSILIAIVILILEIIISIPFIITPLYVVYNPDENMLKTIINSYKLGLKNVFVLLGNLIGYIITIFIFVGLLWILIIACFGHFSIDIFNDMISLIPWDPAISVSIPENTFKIIMFIKYYFIFAVSYALIRFTNKLTESFVDKIKSV